MARSLEERSIHIDSTDLKNFPRASQRVEKLGLRVGTALTPVVWPEQYRTVRELLRLI